METGQELLRGMKLGCRYPKEAQRARAAPHIHWEGSTYLSRSNGSGQKGKWGPLGSLTERELTNTGPEGSRVRAEKEPEGLCGPVWQR